MSCTPDISSRGLLSKYLGNGCLHSCARQTRCVLTEKLGTFVVGWDRVELTAAFPPSPSVGPSTPTPVLPPGCAWEHAAAASSRPQAVPAPAGARESQRGSLDWSAAKLAAGKLSSGALWSSHYVQEPARFGWALVEPLGALARMPVNTWTLPTTVSSFLLESKCRASQQRWMPKSFLFAFF